MKRRLLALTLALAALSAQAQTDVLIEADTGRKEGIFIKSPVFQRAILSKPAQPAETVLLFFRGYPGIARIRSLSDKQGNLLPFMKLGEPMFLAEGIALAVMDCPTDQWGVQGPNPSACLDDYRSSQQHADDVRKIIAKLRTEHGFSNIFILGHSFGSISSRWLAKNLGNEISGSIHSASMNGYSRRGHGSSLTGFDYDAIAAPVLHLHNQDDACPGTPYAVVREYAGPNLVSISGGDPEGDPCGGTHLHSYRGREEIAVRSIIAWIKQKTRRP
jgi:hypothetical protein